MYAVAEQVQQWVTDGREVLVAQVVATRGFSSRDHAAALAWSGDLEVGTLGVPADVPRTPGRHDVVVTDAAAAGAGLSCGGTATVLVRPADAFPDGTWDLLADRAPLCLVSAADGTGTALYTPDTVRDAGFAYADEVPRLFGRGTSQTALMGDVAVVALWPVPSLLVVGDGLIADALCDQAALLGWSASTTTDAAAAVAACAGLRHSDAVVVLSHDREVDGPALAAALASGAGYVGALGSRRTQAARREWLTDRGVTDLGRIHGPAGLDIDAHTPPEIAVSIVAEILGERSAASGGSLRDRPGPVHVAGVQAPPPRYDAATPTTARRVSG